MHRALRECCGIREMAVVEHVVGPQREGVGVKAGEFLSAHAVGDFIRKARGFLEREIASVANVHQVTPQHAAVEA